MTALAEVDAKLSKIHRSLVQHARHHRVLYSVVATAVFLIGLGISINSTAVHAHDFRLIWLLANILLTAPIAIALTATGLKLSARMAGVALTFSSAFKTCCIATASNVLPLPAGTLVHTSALVAQGASVTHSSIVILCANLISFGLVISLAGGTLIFSWPILASFIVGTGIAIAFSSAWILSRRSKPGFLLHFVILSTMRSAVLVLRLFVSFAALGISVNLADAALFAGAAAAGTLVVIAPSGMGISESLAALLSLATNIEAAQAFVAVAINSLTALTFAGIVAISSTTLAKTFP